MTFATYAYLKSKNLNWDRAWGYELPRHLKVLKAEFVRERLFCPSRPIVLRDYKIFYYDGTYDRVSLSGMMVAPKRNAFYQRVCSLSERSYSTWTPDMPTYMEDAPT